MANVFLKKLETAYKLGFNDGQKTGQQQAFDAATICLIREGRSGQQLVDFFNQSCKVIDRYAEAWNPSMEQDIAQYRLDEELEAGYDGAIAFLPFAQCYPDVKTLGYDRPTKEERHPAAKKHGRKKK